MKQSLFCGVLLAIFFYSSIQVNAANRRVVVRNEIQWDNVYIYAYNSTETVKPFGEWPGTIMTKIGNDGTYDWYEAFINDSEGYTIIINKNSEQTPNISLGTNDGDKVVYVYYYNGVGASVQDVTYKFVTTDGSSAVELSGSDCSYSATMDFSSISSEGVYYAFAPSYALNDNANTIKYWSLVGRPNNNGSDYEVSGFFNYSAGMTATEKVWKLLPVNATFNLNFDVKNKTFAFNPYIEKTIDSDKYATFSCGYDVEIPAGITVYSATKSSTSSIHLNEESISALSETNGVLIYGNAGSYKFTPATSTASGVTSGNVFAASGNSGVAITADDYILAGTGNNLGFYHPIDAGTLGAFKAYIPASFSTGAKISFNFDATAINELEATQTDGAFYTLQGVRVDNPQRGIFIRNGKKVVIK